MKISREEVGDPFEAARDGALDRGLPALTLRGEERRPLLRVEEVGVRGLEARRPRVERVNVGAAV